MDFAQLGAAVSRAAEWHAGQTRKWAAGDPRPAAPYISHLLAVAGMVIEDGGDLEEAIAGLLHDVLEDQNHDGDKPALIEQQFGQRVLHLVEACTGPKKDDPGMAEFRVRKQVYLDRLRAETDAGAIRVSLCDKVHNARATVNDLEADGPAVWPRFDAGPEDQLWWYRGLADAYRAHAATGRADAARAGELARLVRRMGQLA